MDRRQLLSRLPIMTTAVAAAVHGPTAVAAADEPSELMHLFRAWDAYDRAAWDVESDEQSDAIYDRLRQLETAMMAIPAATAVEFAAKLIVLTSYGDWMLSREFIAEAARICGASRADSLAVASAEGDL